MSDLPGHDHDPDPAALDELRRAFAIREPDESHDGALEITQAAPEAAPEATAAATAATPVASGDGDAVDDDTPPWLEDEFGGSDAPDEVPFDLVIVEQEPPAEPTPPRLIRIDGYAGSTEVPPAEAPTPVNRPAPAGASADAGAGAAAPEAAGVITISDDDLPDAVYVQGSLERDGSGTIVFIEDDITGDTLAPESERDVRRGIEPRMRERRVAVKRAQGRRRLRRVLIVAVVVLLVVGVLAVLGSPLFAVRADDVRVFGAVYTDRDRLQEIIDDAVGTPVLRLDTAGIEAQVEEIPWVDDAVVRSDFPHGLVIDIRERAAIATYQGPDQRFRVLDREGRVLDVLDLYPFAYVLIVGPDAVDLDAGAFAPQGYAAAAELAKNLTGTVRGHVTMIEVTADGSRLTMQLDDGSTVFFGEARDLLAKLVRLEAVMANGQEREPGLIDVSTAGVTR